MEYPLTEGAWSRTSKDYFDAFHSYGWCSFGLGIAAIVWEGFMIVAPLYFLPSSITNLRMGWIQAIAFVGGMVIFLAIVFLVCGLFTPYRQRNEARKRVVELEDELKKPKLFDVKWGTTRVHLPLNHREDGTWIASSAKFSPSPIIIVHRGDLTKITRVTAAPEVRFIYEDGTGWETTPAITVTPQRPLPPSMRAPGATDFEWDVSNPSQWELTGLPLTMAKDEPLELPAMAIGILDATLAGTHFAKRDKCALTVRLTIRTDKGSPVIPDFSIEMTVSDIKNSMHLFKPNEKETDGPIER